MKACWRAAGSTCGKAITFKTTLKGSNLLMKNGLGDLWMPILCLGGLLASLGFGLHKVRQPPCMYAAQGLVRLLVQLVAWSPLDS